MTLKAGVALVQDFLSGEVHWVFPPLIEAIVKVGYILRLFHDYLTII